MARYNNNKSGDKDEITKVVICPSEVYDLTQIDGAQNTILRAAMRQKTAARVLHALAEKQALWAEIEAECKAAMADW